MEFNSAINSSEKIPKSGIIRSITKITPSNLNNDLNNDVYKNIMLGNFENCPSLGTKMIKIFLSSTFSDMVKERNIIMKYLYPKLRLHCRQNYGIEFQILDMRWGVPSDTQLDHRGNEVCFQEIVNCKEISCGINFITIVGHRYGTISLPFSIKGNDFKMMTTVLRDQNIETDILEEWYIVDNNNDPPIHTLKPIPTVSEEPTFEEIRAARQKWSKKEEVLAEKITKAVNILIENGKMSVHDKKKFCSSVTELEIEMGICNEPKSRINKCAAAFIREITDITSFIDEPKANRFIDVKEVVLQNNFEKKIQVVVDETLHQIMENIIDFSIKRNLNIENVRHFKTCWEDMKEKEEDSEYMSKFQIEFLEVVKDIIDKNIEDNKDTADDLYNEVLQHSIACVKHVKHFQGRVSLIDQVKNYIQGNSNIPFIVYGESGSGKTSILAKSAFLSRTWLDAENASNAVVLLRFLGTSPGTSNIRQTIRYLCRQLSFICGEEDSASKTDDFKELLQKFYQLLERLSEFRKIIIFLDSLDQLQSLDGAYSLSWLVTPLRTNVKMILSTLPQHEGILDNIRLRFEDNSNFLEVKSLEQSTCMDILVSLLREKERTLTEQQKDIVRAAFNACSLPIFVNLIYKTVQKWRSYHTDTKKELALKFTVREEIFQFFRNLEKMFNKTYVKHSLAYITASRNGLSEAELEDILSLDDTVLRSIFEFSVPPQIRVPPFLWSRIRQEIGSYLVEREADNCRVLYWYHRQFIEVANEYFLSDNRFKIYIHDHMSDYFLGTYSNNRPKRFYYPSYIAKKQNLPPYTDESRNMPSQPLIYNQDINGNIVNTDHLFNYRKINELPWHLANAGRLAEFGDHIAFNYKFIFTKLRVSSRSSLLEDLSLLKHHSVSYQNSLDLLYNAIRLSTLSLSHNPSNISFDLVGRLSKYSNNSHPRIMDLLEQGKRDSYLDIGFIPNGQSLESGNGLLYLWYDIGMSMGVVLPNNQLMTISLIDTIITYFDIDGNIVKTVDTEINAFMALKVLMTRRPILGNSNYTVILKKSNKTKDEGKDQGKEDDDVENSTKKLNRFIYQLNLYSGHLTELKELKSDISDDNIFDLNEKYIQFDSRTGMGKLMNFRKNEYIYEYNEGVIHSCLSLDDMAASVMYNLYDHSYMDIVSLENEEITTVGIVSDLEALCCYNMHYNKLICMYKKKEEILFIQYNFLNGILEQSDNIIIKILKLEIKRIKVVAFHNSDIVVFTIQFRNKVVETPSTHGYVYKRKTDSILPLFLDDNTSKFKTHLSSFGESVQCLISEDEELLMTSGNKCLIISWSLIDGNLLQVITRGTAEGLFSGIFSGINKVAICHFPDDSFQDTDERMYILEKVYNIEELKKPMDIVENLLEDDLKILEDHISFKPNIHQYREFSFDALEGLLLMDDSSSTFLIDTLENQTLKSTRFDGAFLNLQLLESSNLSKDVVFRIDNINSAASETIIISKEEDSPQKVETACLDETLSQRLNPRKYLFKGKQKIFSFTTLIPEYIISFEDIQTNDVTRLLNIDMLWVKNSSKFRTSYSWNVEKFCEEYNKVCLPEHIIKKFELCSITLRNNYQNQVVMMYTSKDRKYDEVLNMEKNQGILWSGVIIILEIIIENNTDLKYVLVNSTVADIGRGLALLKDGQFGINYKLEKIDIISGKVVEKVGPLENNCYILYPILSNDDHFLIGTKWFGPNKVQFSFGIDDEPPEDSFALLPPRTLEMFYLEKHQLVASYPFENEPGIILVSRNNSIFNIITLNEPIRCLKLNYSEKNDSRIAVKYGRTAVRKNAKNVNKSHVYLKLILTEALKEVVEKRPSDPISFLASYLYNVK